MSAGAANDGENATGLTAAGVVNRGALGPSSSTTVYGGVGIGTGYGEVTGRVGLSFGW
jgi:hypothetical protein